MEIGISFRCIQVPARLCFERMDSSEASILLWLSLGSKNDVT